MTVLSVGFDIVVRTQVTKAGEMYGCVGDGFFARGDKTTVTLRVIAGVSAQV